MVDLKKARIAELKKEIRPLQKKHRFLKKMKTKAMKKIRYHTKKLNALNAEIAEPGVLPVFVAGCVGEQ